MDTAENGISEPTQFNASSFISGGIADLAGLRCDCEVPGFESQRSTTKGGRRTISPRANALNCFVENRTKKKLALFPRLSRKDRRSAVGFMQVQMRDVDFEGEAMVKG
ncbi:hypothetical protein R3X27_10175 [Tropicimonas sp. TH_r6]|uniref:hypothetical protein n=1 Tax=Tropicimonas sp. TH_r6 TaxID=3082085 RepID=UPI002954C3AF|nr:hypothetical protein [Tropicimonas sp. TH_r6]MDV7143050.1 hypothetical protein [Tropicimonas sp. TH_r6]